MANPDLGYCTVKQRNHILDDFHSVYLPKAQAHAEVCRHCGRNTGGYVIQR